MFESWTSSSAGSLSPVTRRRIDTRTQTGEDPKEDGRRGNLSRPIAGWGEIGSGGRGRYMGRTPAWRGTAGQHSTRVCATATLGPQTSRPPVKHARGRKPLREGSDSAGTRTQDLRIERAGQRGRPRSDRLVFREVQSLPTVRDRARCYCARHCLRCRSWKAETVTLGFQAHLLGRHMDQVQTRPGWSGSEGRQRVGCDHDGVGARGLGRHGA